MDLSNRVAIVTGGARGIGRATALALARAGADVCVNYLQNRDAATEVVDAITDEELVMADGGGADVAVIDDVADTEDIAKKFAHRFGVPYK